MITSGAIFALICAMLCLMLTSLVGFLKFKVLVANVFLFKKSKSKAIKRHDFYKAGFKQKYGAIIGVLRCSAAIDRSI